MNRRFFGAVLALCVLLTMAAPAFAADEPEYRLASVTCASAVYVGDLPRQSLLSYDNGGWLPTRIEPDDGLNTIEVTYDEAGRALSVKTDTREQTFTYDEAGNLLEDHDTMYDGGSIFNESVRTYTYNDNGDELSNSYSDVTPGADPYSYTIQNIYDENGALVGEDWDFPGMYTAHIDHAYNEQGDEIAYDAVQTSADGTESSASYQYEYTYDEAGNMTSKTTTRNGEADGTVTYAYDEQGRQISEVGDTYEAHTFYQPLLEAKWERRTTYSLDENGQVGSERIEDKCFSVLLYDAAGNLICDWCLDAPEVPTPEYDENGYLVRVSCGEGEQLELTYEPVA